MAEARLTDRVRAALEQLEWVVTPDPEHQGGLHLQPSDGEAPWPLVVAVDEDERSVVVHSLVPDDVPAERRGPVLQVLNVANLGLETAAFDLDPDDGEVTARSFLRLGGAELDDTQLTALVGELVGGNLEAMDGWLDQVQAVAGGLELQGPDAT